MSQSVIQSNNIHRAFNSKQKNEEKRKTFRVTTVLIHIKSAKKTFFVTRHFSYCLFEKTSY
jgi:hypothetical protein